MLLTLTATVLLMAPSASALTVGGNHSFDALLSLRGDTATDQSDLVPDPGPTHPPAPFAEVEGTAVDSAGDVYVSSKGWPAGGRIDIFQPNGEFIQEIDAAYGPTFLAVDGAGNLYVKRSESPSRILRYAPSSYPPTTATDYGTPVEVPLEIGPESGIEGFAVNPADDHLLVAQTNPMPCSCVPHRVVEYGSAVENNAFKRRIGEGTLQTPYAVAVNGNTGEIFVSSTVVGESTAPTVDHPYPSVIYVFDSSGNLIGTVDGADTPEGGFIAAAGTIIPAVDETTGELFVGELRAAKRVFRFVPSGPGTFHNVADAELEDHFYATNSPGSVAVSNAPGAMNQDYVFVASASASEPVSHLFAFAPQGETGPPIIRATSFGNVGEAEATVSAEVDPHGRATTYHFEYVTVSQFEEDGFASAARTSEAAIGGGTEFVPVSQNLIGLSAGTAYRFRVVAQNCAIVSPPSGCVVSEGEHEGGGSGPEVPHVFATFSPPPVQTSCPNASLRIGPSAALPDCRAYERVSPAGAGGHPVTATSLGAILGGFPTPLAASDGEAAIFETSTGTMPGFNGNGYLDRYHSVRHSDGWLTEDVAPTGAQMEVPNPGGASADLATSFWATSGGNFAPDSGNLVRFGRVTNYVRRPDGSFELLGQGRIGFEPEVEGRFISPGGTHAIFISETKLEEGAPASGMKGIYDRTLDGVLHVISLLPGGNPPAAPANVVYRGTSMNGNAVAFSVAASGASTLYLRLGDAETVEVAGGSPEYGGLSADGSVLTYLQGGNVFSYDVAGRVATPVGSGGKSTLVNVSADGSHVYFISTKKLAAGGTSGQNNFYVWSREAGTITFIGAVTATDVSGEDGRGLGLWTAALAGGQTSGGEPGRAASRTSDDGRFIVFESRADLTGEAGGEALKVYRFDSATGGLNCVSCNPTLAAPVGGAHLETINGSQDEGSPLNEFALIENVSADGRMVFFETSEALVARDTNGVQDVYEWEDTGVGGCVRPTGCVSLISLGHGSSASYLYGTSSDGRDVFFVSTDALVPGADGGIPALYDARIDGGFAAAAKVAGCRLDACQGAAAGPPAPASPASSAIEGPEGPSKVRHCRKGRRRLTRHGKTRCVKKRPRHRHRNHRRHTSKSQGGSK